MTHAIPTASYPLPTSATERLRPYWPALLIGMLTLLYGFGMGIVFGAGEDELKGIMKESADAVMVDVYKGDAEKAKTVLAKAWTYQKRSHIHAGGLGAASLVLIILLALATRPSIATRTTSLMLSIGGFGYAIFWMIAGFAAPGLGGTGAAKDAFEWLAMPSAGAVVLGTLATTILVTLALARKPQPTA